MQDMQGIESVLATSGNTIHVRRASKPEVKIFTLGVDSITAAELRSLIGEDPVDFVVNVPKDSTFDDDVIGLAQELGFGFGGLGDLARALKLDSPASYVPKQVDFILRGLRQHSAVESVERIAVNLYRLKGRHWPELTMIDLDAYELPGEAVRQALDNHVFDFVLASNAYRGPTSAAIEVAAHAGKKLVIWKELYSNLHKPWN
ncbi:MAG: hypothetical protein ABL984_15590 [Pyrinomonadaceae bacterium]